MPKQLTPTLWEEPKKKYDFAEGSDMYLQREDLDKPDILLYPPWRVSLLKQLGDKKMLTGKALEEYNTLNKGGQDVHGSTDKS